MIHFLSKCNIHGVTFAAIEALPMCALDAQVVTQPMPLTPSYEPLFGWFSFIKEEHAAAADYIFAIVRAPLPTTRSTLLHFWTGLEQILPGPYFIHNDVWNALAFPIQSGNACCSCCTVR